MNFNDVDRIILENGKETQLISSDLRGVLWRKPYNISKTVYPSESGQIIGIGNKEGYGKSIEISAIANEGYVFQRWNDDYTEYTRTVNIAEDVFLSAYFTNSLTLLGGINPMRDNFNSDDYWSREDLTNLQTNDYLSATIILNEGTYSLTAIGSGGYGFVSELNSFNEFKIGSGGAGAFLSCIFDVLQDSEIITIVLKKNSLIKNDSLGYTKICNGDGTLNIEVESGRNPYYERGKWISKGEGGDVKIETLKGVRDVFTLKGENGETAICTEKIIPQIQGGYYACSEYKYGGGQCTPYYSKVDIKMPNNAISYPSDFGLIKIEKCVP